ncbi:MAG: hypothetical protein IH936_09390 [Acidobacteria bacterium]|nr:hypothetical protein [Acidobacteriota bacterium]
MRPGIFPFVVVALLAVAVLSQGCALLFSGDDFQRLKIFFKLTEALAQGEATLVHTWFFPAKVGVKKRWVEVSGRATAPEGGALPANVIVVVRFEDLASEKKLQTVILKLKIGGDGAFSAKKKIKKDVAADSLMIVTVKPAGSDLEIGTELTLCVDLAASKGDLKKLPACVAGGGNSGPATLTELQTDIFTPTCDRFGCHNADSARAGLVLAAGMSFAELVNEPSSQRPEFDRVEPGDPESSYLVKKLRGDADITGDRMPEGGAAFLTDAQIARVISWINDGAEDN